MASVSRSPQGHLFVLDWEGDDIKILDGHGRFLRRIGGPGRGPEALGGPGGLGWDAFGRLWVANGTLFRYTVFDSLGNLIKTERRPARGWAARYYRLWFDEGRFLDFGQGRRRAVVLLRVDTAGLPVDTISSLERHRRPWEVGVYPLTFDKDLIRYLPVFRWTIAPDGTIWTTRGDRLGLVNMTLGGDTVRLVEINHRSDELDRHTRQRIEEEYASIGVDISAYYVAKPLLHAIHVLEDGHLLVHIEDESSQEDRTPIDVFDPEGRFLGTLDLGFRLSTFGVPAIFGDTLVAVGVGELDVPFLVRLTIER